MQSAEFVEALRHVPDGPAFLANVLGALDEALVTPADLAAFFARCAVVQLRTPAASPMACVRTVGIGDDGAPPWRRMLLADNHDGLQLTTLVNWQTWFEHHVDHARLDADGSPAAVRDPGAGADHASLASFVADVCATRPWWKSDPDPACLGAPWSTQANCWLSTADHDGGHAVPGDDLHGTAYRVASATGLQYRPGTWLLQYTVDAAEARRAAAAAVARPLFADGGNAWFRLHNPSPYGRHCARLGWGNTAHLTPAVPAVANDGRPERVMLRLPFDALPSLRLRLVGQVQAAPHDPPGLDAPAFEQVLFAGVTLDGVVTRLTSCLL